MVQVQRTRYLYAAGKQGFLRTAESLLAIAITLLFLSFVLPSITTTPNTDREQDVLHALRTDDDFRSCVLQKDVACINATIDERLDNRFSFMFNISEDPNTEITDLPDKDIVVNSLFVAGNMSTDTSLVLRLFYWPR